MIDQNENMQLEKVWMATRITWSALLGSLGVYLLVAKILENKLTPVQNMPFGLLKNILFGISILAFIAAFFIRKALLGTSGNGVPSTFRQGAPTVSQAPAAGRYIAAITAASGISEGIGICGLVFFFLSRDAFTLYQFIALSALAMFVYRPRKDELMQYVSDAHRRGTSSSGR